MDKIKISTPFRLASRRPIIWTAKPVEPKPMAKVVAITSARLPAFGRAREAKTSGQLVA